MVQGDQLPKLATFTSQQKQPLLIAGPCSAESQAQVVQAAKAIQAGGKASFFRAGLWKPRTRPNSFEGLGAQALPWLMEAENQTGLMAMTEVASPEHVEQVMKAGMKAVWIGARTTVSPFAVQALADALKGTDMMVLVKNPMHADLKLWIGALERIAQSTQGEVGALHRGFSSYGSREFRNAPMWEIPIALRSEMPEIPMLCDPSHIAGNRTMLADVAQRAMQLGMEGLMLECHPNPDHALSDAEQQITPEALVQLIDDLQVPSGTGDNHDDRDALNGLRMQIDSVDEQLLQLLSKRMELASTIGSLKHRNRWSLLSIARWRDIIRSRSAWGQALGLNAEFLQRILNSVHEESIRVQSDEAKRKDSEPI